MPRTVAIIGSGFGGLCMAIALKRFSSDHFIVFEKADRIGGTWRDNTYPGAACDIMSHLYSYSFEPKPDWSRVYAEQPEILAYLEHCADKYGVTPHVRLGTEIVEARYDELRCVWNLRAADGQTWKVDAVVVATGQLHKPAYPTIAGLDRFRGRRFHSARWDHDCDLAGARIGVVGTGASAVQFVPPLVRDASLLTLFQRSAPWILPKFDRAYSAYEKTLYRLFPSLLSLSRTTKYLWGESRLIAFEQGGRYNELVRWVATHHMEKAVPDADRRAKLTPDYPPGCKRLIISNDYFEALAKPNVSIVTEAIAHADEDGLVTDDGVRHPFDVLVFGTGFETTQFIAPMRVVGESGVELSDTWRDGAEAYLGIMAHGFPNFFVMYGPNTNLAHNSIVFMLEAQAHYVTECLALLDRERALALSPKAASVRAFSEEMQQRFSGSIWEAGCTSWYKTASGRNTNNWPGFTFEYWWRTRRPRRRDFDLERAH
ncbi:MAG: NAD(P)/FAD-dependent oxidoreductase [Polyangiaceae bacterium]|nr:NAD(P)/FAD-dependent oxidoreductase [Polyangiaceae bacterium]